jgi:hypothetical protein
MEAARLAIESMVKKDFSDKPSYAADRLSKPPGKLKLKIQTKTPTIKDVASLSLKTTPHRTPNFHFKPSTPVSLSTPRTPPIGNLKLKLINSGGAWSTGGQKMYTSVIKTDTPSGTPKL